MQLLQFSKMASIYIRNLLNILKPKFALLNIGAEENKGNELAK